MLAEDLAQRTQGMPAASPPRRWWRRDMTANGYIDPSATKIHLTTKQLIAIIIAVSTLTVTVLTTYIATRQSILDLDRNIAFERRYNDLRVGYTEQQIAAFEHNFGIMTAYTVSLREKMIEAGVDVSLPPRLRRVPRPVQLLEMDAERDQRDEEENQ